MPTIPAILPSMTEPAGSDPFPIGAQFGTGTAPDGKVWVIMRITDGTCTSEFRMPPETAAQFGRAIAEGLAGAAEQAGVRTAASGLVVPPGVNDLVIPQPVIRQNGAGRR